ncbi:MAG: uroporphyrinogen-III C-methyltransferase [Anaerorhabdus sp.]
MDKGVYLVGAGPGSQDLISVEGLRLIKKCDVLVYDRLVNTSFLSNVKEGCKLIYAGKQSGNHSMDQKDINELLYKLSLKNEIVVRLKGGDPFVFGRGSEEALFLIDKGVDVTVISGISSSIAGLKEAGIPITARGYASSFHVFTGHFKDDAKLDFETIAKLDGTLVFMMGIKNLDIIVNGLIDFKMNKSTQVALIYKASTSFQKEYVGTLETISKIAKENNVLSPAIIVVGDVVKFYDVLKPTVKKKKKVVITRERRNNEKFANKLIDEGFDVCLMPCIKYEKFNFELLKEKIKLLADYSGIIFTSSMAIDIFFDALFKMNKDSRILSNKKIIVVSKGSKERLIKYGVIADEVCGYDLDKTINRIIKSNEKYLFPSSLISDKSWVDKINVGSIDALDCYDTKSDLNSFWDDRDVMSADYITFTSVSVVRGFIDKLKKNKMLPSEVLKNIKVVSIGKKTTKYLMENDIAIDFEAEYPSIELMIDYMRGDF